jgi:hypothetical protein
MPLRTIGYGLLPFVFLPLIPLPVFASYIFVVKAPARLREKLHSLRVGSYGAFRVGEARNPGTLPPRYSPKIENEPEKRFRINGNRQKRTRERT